MSDQEKNINEQELENLPEAEACESCQAAADTAETEVREDTSVKLEQELAESKDKYLRLCAEYDNYRKRTTKEKTEAYGDATAKAATEFLSVIDNFERALGVETTDETFKSGIQMIFNQYCEILKRLGIEEIEALNKPFDPALHNAISQTEDENFGDNTVSQVFQKGYKLGDRVIRHAMVAVANP